MKKIRKIGLLLVVLLTVLIFLITSYASNERKEHLYKKNTYTINYLELEKNKKVTVADKIFDYLPQEVSETNLLGEERFFDVTYEVNGEIKDLDNSSLFFNCINNGEANSFQRSLVTISLVDVERNYRQEMKFIIEYGNVEILPLIINRNTVIDDIKIALVSEDGSFYTEMLASVEIKNAIKRFVDFEDLSGMYSMGELNLTYVNKDYLNPSDDLMIEKIFDKTWAIVDSKWTEYLKEEFLKIPHELRELAFHEGLVISVADFNDRTTEAYIEQTNEFYDEGFTVNIYNKWVLATYSDRLTAILFNIGNDSSILNDNFAQEFISPNITYTITPFKDYERLKFGNNELESTNQKTLYFKSDILNTLYHEFGHFLENRSTYSANFTEEEFSSLISKFSYCYDNKYDNEVIAHGFAIYFDNKEYVFENLPVMQREIDGVLNELINRNKMKANLILERHDILLEKAEKHNTKVDSLGN